MQQEVSLRSSYSGEPIEEIKSMITSQAQSLSAYNSLKEKLKAELGSREPTREEVLDYIKQQDIAEDILKSIKEETGKKPAEAVPVPLSEDSVGLKVQILQGKDFWDYAENPGEKSLFCAVSFFGQRYVTKPVQASLNPVFNEVLVFEIKGKAGGKVDLGKLASSNNPLHVVMIEQNNKTRKRVLIGTKKVDWRHVLHAKSIEQEAVFNKMDLQKKDPLGVLSVWFREVIGMHRYKWICQKDYQKLSQFLSIQWYNSLNMKQNITQISRKPLTNTLPNGGTTSSKSANPTKSVLFLSLLTLTTATSRTFPFCLIVYRAYRPVNSLLLPLQSSRLLESPFHAFRFVSLIPFDRAETLGGKRIERWHTFHSFLAKGSGDVEDHCTLFCSLLLGFGLDAYIAVGTAGDESHVWVLTRVQKLGSPLKTITFWETMTGQRLDLDDPRVSKFYKSISCVFSAGKFYANIQADDRVANVYYDFENDMHWKAMTSESMQLISTWNFPVPLLPPKVNSLTLAEKVETFVKEKLVDYRMSAMLASSTFDESLSYMLGPALSNYELERVCGLTFGNDEFKAAITQAVPDGHMFKAFPIQTQGADPQKVFAGLMQNKVAREILDTKGDLVRFAVRAKVTVYPEDVVAIWTILAVRYRAVVQRFFDAYYYNIIYDQ
eukprot:TRINITY_DN594_c0_g1_i1.p1 TRINITY_DN594_c0_g1~~TRINITY_DN594_c0_g1_i1.p1  ORF type:complete len:663 (-),score=32.86 TRINITY_DN594_c0_g1_i1:2653-4641(-)